MKTNLPAKRASLGLLAVPLLMASLASSQAGDVVKANNTSSLVSGGSWVGGLVPGIADAAVFDDTFTSTANLGTGGALNWDSLRVEGVNPNDRVYIPNTTYNNFVGIGLGGVDLSAAPRDLLIRGFVANFDHTWNIATGRLFEVGGTRFGGAGNIDITGDGLVILGGDSGADVYSGTLTVSGGTLRLLALEGGNVVVNDGGTLDSEAFLPGDLTLGSATGASLVIDPDPGAALDVGDLILTGVNTVYLSSAPAGAGSIDVVKYVTTTGDETNFSLDPGAAANLRHAPTFSDTIGTITLNILAGDTLTWTGSPNSDWDINTTANWDNGSPTNFFDLDAVVFDDTASNKTVTVTEAVAPQSTSFTNSSGNDYTVDGAGGISGGGAVNKSGTGTVTLTNTNPFTGATGVDGGTLALDYTAGGTPLSGTSDIAITAPGTVRATHDDGVLTLNRPISGDGTLRLNAHAAVGSADGFLITLSGDNSAFTGSMIFESPLSGFWRSDNTSQANLGGATVTVESSAQLFTVVGASYSNLLTITGDGYMAANGQLGAMRLQNNTRWTGDITVTGTPGDSAGTSPDASIGLGTSGTGTLIGYVDGSISGGDLGLLGYSGSGNEWVYLTNANSYGDSIVRANDIGTAGQLALVVGGSANTTATLGTGDVHLLGGAGGKAAALRIQREDGYSLPGDVLSGGNTLVTNLLIDTIGAGVSTNGKTVTIGGQIRVSPNVSNSVLTIDSGSLVTCDTMSVAHSNGSNGTLNLDGGVVNLGAGGVITSGNGVVNMGGGTLFMTTGCDVDVPVNVTATSTIDIDGSFVQLLDAITGPGDLVLADTSGGGALVLNTDTNITYDGALSGPATIFMGGAGTFTLGGASTNTGDMTVDGGGLHITGSLSGSDLYIDGGALHTGGSLTGNLSMGTTAAATIEYTGTPLAVTGSVTISDIVVPIEVNPFSSGILAAGSYPLVTYTGTLTGDASMLSLPAGFVPGDYRQSFSFTAGGGSINLVVTGSPANLVWGGPGDWDLHTTMPWMGAESFFQLDSALFDDTATDGSVNLVGSLTPQTVTVNNDLVPFTFSGAGSLDGPATLTKEGPGTLTVDNTNGYSGGTLIDGGGEIQVNGIGALGGGAVTISDGTLRVNVKNAITNALVMGDVNSATAETVLEYELASGNSLNMPTTVSGDAPGSKAIIRVIGPGGVGGQNATYFAGSIFLDGRDVYFDNAAGRIGGLSGKISGTGDLHITDTPGSGANRCRLLSNANDFDGDVYVDSGYLQIGTGGTSGNVTAIPSGSDLTIAAGAFAGATGDAVPTVGGLFGSGIMTTNVSGSNTCRLTVGNDDRSGVFDGTMANQSGWVTSRIFAFTKTGAGTQVLNGDCTFTGSTIISGGVLEINSTTYTSSVTVNGDGTLGGTGMLGKNVTVSSVNASVAPGASTGTLTVSGNVALGSGTLSIEIDDGASPQNDRLDVGGTLTVTSAFLDITGSPGEDAYIIASYGSLVGTFASENIPLGYEVRYNYHDLNQIALVVVGGTDYDGWAGGFGLDPDAEGSPTGDADGDGVSNGDEYAYGLIPNDPSSVNPITVPLDATGTFRYTRRTPGLTGLVYAIDRSADLLAWGIDATATAGQNVISTALDVELVEVTLTAPLGAEEFARVVASPAP